MQTFQLNYFEYDMLLDMMYNTFHTSFNNLAIKSAVSGKQKTWKLISLLISQQLIAMKIDKSTQTGHPDLTFEQDSL